MGEPSRRQPPVPPIIVLIVGILAVSTASGFFSYAQAYAPSLVIAAYRLSLATLVLAPLALTRHRAELSHLLPGERALAALSGMFLALHFASWITSLEYTSVASSVVLVSTTPLWVALFSPFTLREPLTGRVWLGMGLAMLGGVVVGLSDTCRLESRALICPDWRTFVQGEAFLGDMLALFGALMAAAYVLIGRRLRAKLSLVGYVFMVYGAAAVVLVGIMALMGHSPWGYPPVTYLWFVLLALVPQLLGHSSFNWALGYVSAAYVSITLLGEPIGSTTLAYFLLRETPTALKIIGAILILSGIYIASQNDNRKVRQTS